MCGQISRRHVRKVEQREEKQCKTSGRHCAIVRIEVERFGHSPVQRHIGRIHLGNKASVRSEHVQRPMYRHVNALVALGVRQIERVHVQRALDRQKAVVRDPDGTDVRHLLRSIQLKLDLPNRFLLRRIQAGQCLRAFVEPIGRQRQPCDEPVAQIEQVDQHRAVLGVESGGSFAESKYADVLELTVERTAVIVHLRQLGFATTEPQQFHDEDEHADEPGSEQYLGRTETWQRGQHDQFDRRIVMAQHAGAK